MHKNDEEKKGFNEVMEQKTPILMPLSPGPMARHISSKAATTGDLQMARKTQTIPNLSVKGLMEYLTMLMLPLFGLEMGKSISSKEHNTGGLNLTTVHQ